MRKREDFWERISRLIKQPADEIQASCASWGHRDQPTRQCWPGPKFIKYRGRATPPVRAMLTEELGEMHYSWMLKRVCSVRDCCQPTHWKMYLVPRVRLECKAVDLPQRVKDAEMEEIMEAAAGGMSLDETIDLILMIEGRNMPAEQLAERFDEPIELINQALEIIHRDGM